MSADAVLPRAGVSALLRQAALFFAVSGMGWLLDVAVFMTLSGPGGWPALYANMVSGTCGTLFVFVVSMKRIFSRNGGSVGPKLAVLLPFNLANIVISSFVLRLIAEQLGLAAAEWSLSVAPSAILLAAKMLVTPFTLLLNFVVIRFLVERFVRLR